MGYAMQTVDSATLKLKDFIPSSQANCRSHLESFRPSKTEKPDNFVAAIENPIPRQDSIGTEHYKKNVIFKPSSDYIAKSKKSQALSGSQLENDIFGLFMEALRKSETNGNSGHPFLQLSKEDFCDNNLSKYLDYLNENGFKVKDTMEVEKLLQNGGFDFAQNTIQGLLTVYEECSDIREAQFVIQYMSPESSGYSTGGVVLTVLVPEDENTDENFDLVDGIYSDLQKHPIPKELHIRLSSMEWDV